jgi:hypothetical protein
LIAHIHPISPRLGRDKNTGNHHRMARNASHTKQSWANSEKQRKTFFAVTRELECSEKPCLTVSGMFPPSRITMFEIPSVHARGENPRNLEENAKIRGLQRKPPFMSLHQNDADFSMRLESFPRTPASPTCHRHKYTRSSHSISLPRARLFASSLFTRESGGKASASSPMLNGCCAATQLAGRRKQLSS